MQQQQSKLFYSPLLPQDNQTGAVLAVVGEDGTAHPLEALPADTGGDVPAGVIYRPGGVSAGNVLATAKEVKQAIADVNGAIVVFCDGSLTGGVCLWPEAGLGSAIGVTDCLGTARFVSYGNNENILRVVDGASFKNLRGIGEGLNLQGQCTTTPALSFTASGAFDVLGNSATPAILERLSGATVAMCSVTGAEGTLAVYTNTAALENDQAGAVGLFDLGVSAVLAILSAEGLTIEATGPIVTGVASSTLEFVSLDPATQVPLTTVAWPTATMLGTVLAEIAYAAPGTPLWDQQWYQAGTIFIDPQNVSTHASDANSGLTSGAPLLTWAEAVRRWGSDSPQLSVNLAITFLSSHTDNTDPVTFSPFIRNNAQISIQGTTPTVSTSTTFTRSAAKSRAAGSNSPLAGSFAAGTIAPGLLVQNTTAAKSSRAFVYKTAGGANWFLTQPCAPAVLPLSSFGFVTEVDTWNTGDTVNLLAPVQVNLVRLTPTLVDGTSASSLLQVSQLIGFDPTGVQTDPIITNGLVLFSDVLHQRLLSLVAPANSFYPAAFLNVWLAGLAGGPFAHTLQAGALVGGYVTSGGAPGLQGDRTGYLTQDVILDTTGHTSNVSGAQFELVYLASAINVAGPCIITATGVIYGSAAADMNFINASRLTTRGGTWTATVTYPIAVASGFVLNGSRNGNSIAYAGAVGTIHNAIATTVANLDAAAGAAGFGGVAFNPGGAMLSNQG